MHMCVFQSVYRVVCELLVNFGISVYGCIYMCIGRTLAVPCIIVITLYTGFAFTFSHLSLPYRLSLLYNILITIHYLKWKIVITFACT